MSPQHETPHPDRRALMYVNSTPPEDLSEITVTMDGNTATVTFAPCVGRDGAERHASLYLLDLLTYLTAEGGWPKGTEGQLPDPVTVHGDAFVVAQWAIVTSAHVVRVQGGAVTVPSPPLGDPIGPWFRWFAWRPVVTCRRRYQSKLSLPGPTCRWFFTVADKGE